MKSFSSCFALLFVFFSAFWACGPEKEDKRLKMKAQADSIQKARDDAFNKASDENRKKALEDSIQANREYNAQLQQYDSLREIDSSKVKWHHHKGIKPAPKREINGRTLVK
jgi:hypothetical protein